MNAATTRTLPAALAALGLAAGLLTVTATPAHAAARHRVGAAVNYTLAQLGDPYRYGADGPGAFDCSGLTQAAYAHAGRSIPRTSRGQYRAGHHHGRHHWKPGDLIFWSSNGRPSGIYHVGMYLGAWMVAHAPSPGKTVRIVRIFHKGRLLWRSARPIGHDRPMFYTSPGQHNQAVHAVKRRMNAVGSLRDVSGSGYYGGHVAHDARAVRRRVGVHVSGSTNWHVWRYLLRHGATR